MSKTQRREFEVVWDNKEGDVVQPAEHIPNMNLKINDIAEKTLHYIQINHLIEKPRRRKSGKRKLQKTDFNAMVD